MPSDSRSFFAEDRVGETNKMIGELAEQDLPVRVVHVSHFFWRGRCKHEQDNQRWQTFARCDTAFTSLHIFFIRTPFTLLCNLMYLVLSRNVKNTLINS